MKPTNQELKAIIDELVRQTNLAIQQKRWKDVDTNKRALQRLRRKLND